jgi:hypothetical protein
MFCFAAGKRLFLLFSGPLGLNATPGMITNDEVKQPG